MLIWFRIQSLLFCCMERKMKSIRWLKTDIAVFTCTAILALLGLGFSFTSGLMDPAGRYSHEYNSTGGDDDLCIHISVLLFGVPAILFPWFNGRIRLAVIKVLLFSAVWFLQLLAIHWIEVGSLWITVQNGGNWVLACFISVFATALPAVWIALGCDFR